MMDIYLVVLGGMGDINIKVFDKEVFDWILSPYPGELTETNGIYERSSCVDSTVPESVRKDGEEIHISSHSFDNDRALCIETNIKEYEGCRNFVTLIKTIQERGDTVVDCYEGCIY